MLACISAQGPESYAQDRSRQRNDARQRAKTHGIGCCSPGFQFGCGGLA